MPGQFRVFVGAPSANDVSEPASSYHWYTVSSTQPVLPAATIEAASRRISLIYQNIIFKDDDEDESAEYTTDANGITADDGPRKLLDHGNQTTMITWASTMPSQQRGSNRPASPTTMDVSKSRVLHENTFLEETQDTGCSYSDSSSIARFPQFQFSLLAVNSVTSLVSMVRSAKVQGRLKASVLVAVLEVDGPDMITIKRGRDAGSQVALLKMILGDDEGNVCKITAWREVAEAWGNGTRVQPAIRRGDVVLFQNVLLCWEPPTSPTLNFTASPYLKPRAEICYRTMIYSSQDNKLRPDLRLGYSDASVRRVSSVVNWFQNMAGL